MRRLTYIGLVDRWRVQHHHPTKQGGVALAGCSAAGYSGGWRRRRRGRKKVDSGKKGNDFSASSSSQARKAKWLSRPHRHRRGDTRRRHQDCNLWDCLHSQTPCQA